MTDDFEVTVARIGRRKAIRFFTSRLILIALGLVLIWSILND